MTLVPQNDSILGPVFAQLVLVAQQIEGIGTCYAKVPDKAPSDNSVMFACKHVQVESSTNGRITLHLDVDILHCFRRDNLPAVLTKCYKALPAWMTVLASYKNVTLGGTVQLLDLQGADIKTVVHGGQTMMAVISSVVVRYEFLIPT